jgi:hypothetical protein
VNHNDRACRGGETKPVRMGCEHAQECLACGTRVRNDLVHHPFFGFAAGCSEVQGSRIAGGPQKKTGPVVQRGP